MTPKVYVLAPLEVMPPFLCTYHSLCLNLLLLLFSYLPFKMQLKCQFCGAIPVYFIASVSQLNGFSLLYVRLHCTLLHYSIYYMVL